MPLRGFPLFPFLVQSPGQSQSFFMLRKPHQAEPGELEICRVFCATASVSDRVPARDGSRDAKGETPCAAGLWALWSS